MRKKIITALSLILVFSVLFSSQLIQTARANHDNDHHKKPTTSPVTGPITGPITSPVGLFTISGNVTYHLLGLFRRGTARFLPTDNVKVTVEGLFNHHKITTMTDSSGNYMVDPGKAGFYKVSVSDIKGTMFVPPLQFVNDNKPGGKKHVDFQGLLFKF